MDAQRRSQGNAASTKLRFFKAQQSTRSSWNENLLGLNRKRQELHPLGSGLIEPGGRIVTISEIDRRTIATYIAVQALRTSEQRVALGQHTDIKMSKRDLQSFHLGILFEDSVVQKIAGAIGDCIWIFGRNSSSVPFYTSDHPVAARVHPGHRCIHPFQLPTEGAEIMLPLSATLMFYSYERSHLRSLEKFDGHVSPVRFTNGAR